MLPHFLQSGTAYSQKGLKAFWSPRHALQKGLPKDNKFLITEVLMAGVWIVNVSGMLSMQAFIESLKVRICF